MALKVNKKQSEKTYEYVPMIERGEESPFTVIVRRLTSREYTYIEDQMVKLHKDESVSFTTGSFNWQVCKKGIVDWKNMVDEEGKEIKPVKGTNGIQDDSLNLLPIDMITEIANVIIGLTKDPENADIYLGKTEEV